MEHTGVIAARAGPLTRCGPELTRLELWMREGGWGKIRSACTFHIYYLMMCYVVMIPSSSSISHLSKNHGLRRSYTGSNPVLEFKYHGIKTCLLLNLLLSLLSNNYCVDKSTKIAKMFQIQETLTTTTSIYSGLKLMEYISVRMSIMLEL